MPQRTRKLLCQPVVQAVDQVADIECHIPHVQILPTAVTGENHLFQILSDLNHCLGTWQWAMPQVIDTADVLVGRDNLVGQIGKFFFASKIGGHETCLSSPPVVGEA